MRRETAIVLLLVSAVVVPMWFVAIMSGGHGGEAIALQPGENTTLNPLGYYLNTPAEINVYVAGVVTWLTLFGVVGAVFGMVTFATRVGRQGEPLSADETDAIDLPNYLETPYRKVVAYWPAPASIGGVWLVGLFSVLDVLFASLVVTETFGTARTQFIGLYMGLLCLSLAETVVLYQAYFMPSIELAEERDH